MRETRENASEICRKLRVSAKSRGSGVARRHGWSSEGTPSVTVNRSEDVPISYPKPALGVACTGEKKPCKSARADARTRTGDPFITRERRVNGGRPLAGTSGHVYAANDPVSPLLEWTHVPAGAPAGVPVLYPAMPSVASRRKTGQTAGARPASGGRSGSVSTRARMCSGRIPQQPPTSCAPRSTQLTDALANASGVMSPKIHSGGL